MMIDFSATEKGGSIVDVLSEKDEEGGYISGGWKCEGGRLGFRGKRATMEDLFDIKLPRLIGKQSPCSEFLMVNHINKLMQLFWIPKGIHTVMMLTIYTLPTLEIRVQQYQTQVKVFSNNLLTAS